MTTPTPPPGPRSPAANPDAPRTFGTFAGVFTPTLLTILGVIMYLRLPWVVGNAGLLGGLAIIGLAIGITTATGLSLSSIATNTRIGAGGPYAIISKSLGFEIGGSVGVPLYLSQALVVAMYIFGLREGWNWIFPNHPALLVDLLAFALVMGIAYVSADLAFRIQYVVLAVIVASLIAVLGNVGVWGSETTMHLMGDYRGAPEDQFSGTTFWAVFAVFFPAATGIMAGANMSGELRDPRRSIPLGTLSAIGISTVVYVALAAWSAKAADPATLTANYTIMADRSLWAPLVIAGLLGATFSSALSSLVGAPRILAALGRDDILPGGSWLSTIHGGEPRRAMLVTGVIVLAGLMTRDLNAIAPLITMFFLIAYAVINLVMIAESSLGLMSFRPTLRVPLIVPILGAVGCVFAMFIVNPSFSLVAAAVVFAIYVSIMWQGRLPRTGTVRSGIFVAFAEWAASKVIELDMSAERAWKPNLLAPVRDPATLRGEYRLVADLCKPEGSLKILGLAAGDTVAHLQPRIAELSRSFHKAGVMSTYSVVDSAGYVEGTVTGLQALRSAFFRPNVLFLPLPTEAERFEPLRQVLTEAVRLRVGIMLAGLHTKAGLGRMQVVNLWLSPRRPGQTTYQHLAESNMNLGILTALRLQRAWRGELHLLSVSATEEQAIEARVHLNQLRDLCRIPVKAHTQVLVGDFRDDGLLASVPMADLQIVGLSNVDAVEFMQDTVQRMRSSTLFVRDSGMESALA